MAAITIVQLRAFVAIAQTQHFGDAAALIGVSQPTLSQALSTLEANLDVQLVERSPRQVLITPAGTRLLPLARQAVAAVDAVAEAAAPARWLSGPMRLGVIPTIAPYLLPSVLRTLRREAPDLELAVHEDQTWRLIEALKRGELDLAILALPTSEPGLAEIPLYVEDFVLALPAKSDLAGRIDVDPQILQDLHLLLLDEGHCLRDQALEVCMQAGARDAGADPARASSLATIVQLVSAGMGATLLPATAVPAEARGAALGIAHFR
ncbi:MAG: LysR substrate-binding domain-containing protein, partial [Candidatus Nanopelagicales bacterium]